MRADVLDGSGGAATGSPQSVNPAGTTVIGAKTFAWISRPSTDVAVAWSWLPVAALSHWLQRDMKQASALLGVAFFVSFVHQPLTLGLVYGDRAVVASRRRMYRYTPIVALAAVLIGVRVSATGVALIAGLWNAQHTLMQRYGLTRIYGRKAGDSQGRIEKALYMVWLALAAIIVAGDDRISKIVKKVDLGRTNRQGLDILLRVRGVAHLIAIPLAIAAVVLTVRWWRGERALGERANRAKWVYVASTAALLVTIVVDPLAGFTAYVATHAFEYFVIVNRSLMNRPREESVIAAATAGRARRLGAITLYCAVTAGYSLLCLTQEWYDLYAVSVLTLGALHIFYDGFIWKLRRPQVAASLGLAATPVAG